MKYDKEKTTMYCKQAIALLDNITPKLTTVEKKGIGSMIYTHYLMQHKAENKTVERAISGADENDGNSER